MTPCYSVLESNCSDIGVDLGQVHRFLIGDGYGEMDLRVNLWLANI
jgi:hypothetical protein